MLRYCWPSRLHSSLKVGVIKNDKGAFPPNSSDIFFMVSADCCISNFPTRVDPVKEILRIAGEDVMTLPIAGASPDTTLNTPFGMPAFSASTAKAKADNGVSSEGLSTIVQPTAMAGPALRVIMASGKFQGVMAPTTPIASLVTKMRASDLWVGIISPYMRLPSAANHSRKLAAYATSPLASA